MTMTETPAATYTIAVRNGRRGRKWFNAGCGQTGNREILAELMASMTAEYPALWLDIRPAGECRDLAPVSLRPWAVDDVDDEDVNVDEVADDEL